MEGDSVKTPADLNQLVIDFFKAKHNLAMAIAAQPIETVTGPAQLVHMPQHYRLERMYLHPGQTFTGRCIVYLKVDYTDKEI